MRNTNFGRRFGPTISGYPITIGIAVAVAVSFLVAWIILGLDSRSTENLNTWLAFDPKLALSQPWRFLTYHFGFDGYGGAALGVFCGCYWIWLTGALVENELKPWGFIAFLVVATILHAVIWLIASMFFKTWPLTMPQFLLADLTLIWGSRFPENEIRLFGFIPLKAKWIAWGTVVIMLLTIGTGAPILGLLSVLPLVAIWFWGKQKLPIPYGAIRTTVSTRKSDKHFKEFQDQVRQKETERSDKERLRKIFEASLIDDPDNGTDK